MNWKLFIIACVNSVCLLFPYNIIGCSGGEPDPYDYYVSFFHKNVSGSTGYEPFYYTNYQFLYEPNEPVNVADVTSSEWTGFGGNSFSKKEAYQFVCVFTHKDLSSLYYHLEKNQPLNIPDSVKNNGMTRFFLQQKNLEALGYLLYAKQLEPHVALAWNGWEAGTRDTVKMSRLIKNGQQLLAAAKNDFIKLRYSYQILRLAHYSGRYLDCIKWYDELIKPNPIKSVLQELSLGLKAGAQLRSGNKQQAAYIFSQLFAGSNVKKVSNYLSFDWSVSRFDETSRMKTLLLCKNDIEKANMMSLFALGSNKTELKSIQQIYQLSAKSSLLPVLVTREVNKLEEFFFTPSLGFAQGKERVYIGYTELLANDKQYKAWYDECIQLSDFCKKIAPGDKDVSFYQLAAAHISMIAGDNTSSRSLLDLAKKGTLTPLQQDQWALTNLLLTINTRKNIDDKFEKELMPSIIWLEKKAKSDEEFAKFFRRLFLDILAPKYKTKGDKSSIKYILCSGVGDKIQQDYIKNGWGYYAQTLYNLRRELSAKQAEELVQLMESKQLNDFDKFLISKSSFNKDDINDLVGSAWLRQHNFIEAQKWFKKVPPSYYQQEFFQTYMVANSFADLMLDTHAPTKQDTVKYSKLGFTQKMLRLEKELAVSADKEKKASLHYELAKGYYHMSYWGNSWMLVQYSWSTSEIEYPRADSSFKNTVEYYGVKKAKKHYLEALANTANKNFQARCIFMAAKCDQKQVGNLPSFYSFDSENEYKLALRNWISAFDKRNSFYSQLNRNFSNTPFYKEAFNTCSYLRDFVQKK